VSGTLVVGAAPVAGADGFYRGLLEAADHVVAADAAGEWCVRIGRVPDLVVGDFDSALPGAAERLERLGATVARYAADKDRTDLELAVELARSTFGTPLTLTAAFSARVDHTLASFGALLQAGMGAHAVEPGWRSHVCLPSQRVRFDADPGTLVSLLAPAGADGVCASGVRWPLASARLEALSGLGVSNVALGGPVEVAVARGTVFVFVGT
jgi:thiamine pyrophosphokinase